MEEASDRAINRIGPELQAKLDGLSATLPKAKIQDGKVTCPGCSRVAAMPDMGFAIVKMPATCKECGTKFLVDASAPDGSQGPIEHPTGPPPETPPTAHVLLRNQEDGHEHSVQLDAQGNGVSSKVKGHVHQVKGGEAQPADGHTHQVKRMMAGNMDEEVRKYIKLEDLERVGMKIPEIQDVGPVPLSALMELTDFEKNVELVSYQELTDGKHRATFKLEFEVTW